MVPEFHRVSGRTAAPGRGLYRQWGIPPRPEDIGFSCLYRIIRHSMEKCNPLNQKLSFERRRLWISESMEGEILVYLRISPTGGTGVRTKEYFAPGRGTFVEIQKYPKNLRGFGPGPHGEPSKNMQNTVRRGQKPGYLSHPRPLPLCNSEIGTCSYWMKSRL